MLELHADMQAAVKNIQTEAARATVAGKIRHQMQLVMWHSIKLITTVALTG